MAAENNSDKSDAVDENLAAVLGRIPSGLFIVTASDGAGRETGMLASWVMQSGFDPPTVTVAVNRKRYLIDWLGQTKAMVLHVLGENQNDLLKHFGRGFEPDENAFEGLEIDRSANGLPVLPQALGHLEGQIIDSVDAPDHTIFLLKITSGDKGTLFDDAAPFVHIRRHGLNY